MSYYTVMDFSDGVLHDNAWARAQPLGSRIVVVEPRGTESISDQFSIALGEGRNGSNALRVRSVPSAAAEHNLPGFWLIPQIRQGTGLANPRDSRGYMVPPGTRVNRVGMWLKFPPGYRQSHIASIVSGARYTNFDVGTYHFDPGLISGSIDVKESDNWHGYYKVVLRHDQANGDWIHLVINEMPQHQRGLSGYRVAPGMTATAGGFWSTLTRIYFDGTPYRSDPEVPYPVDMLVDSIYLSYVDEDMGLSLQIENFGSGQEIACVTGQQYDFEVLLTNSTASAITGKIYHRSHYTLSPQLVDAATGLSVHNTDVTVAPNDSRLFIFKLKPTTTNKYLSAIAFSPSSQNTPPLGPLMPNLSETKICISMNAYGQYSPLDGKLVSASLRIVPQDSVTLPPMPWSQGGRVYYGAVGGNITGTLPGSSPSGETLTFSKVSQQSTGGSITINSNGQFTFVPTAGFTGAYFFRYKINDGHQDSKTFGAWVYAGEDESGGGTEPPTPPPPSQELKLQMTGVSTMGFADSKILVR